MEVIEAGRLNISAFGPECCYPLLIMHGEGDPQLSDTPGLL